MAEIAPLTPLRYDLSRLGPAGLKNVVAPPYDVIDAAQRSELLARDPYNIVRLILPEGQGDESQGDERKGDAKYARASELLAAWRNEGVLVRDDEPAFYRYDQTFVLPGMLVSGRSEITRRGFLGLVKLVSLDKGVVLPHERTLSGPKEDRLKLFRATCTNLSPGFMLYRDPNQSLDSALACATELTSFETPDGVRHALAKITDPSAIEAIVACVAKSSLLIADGHHRYETALRYCQEANAAVGGRSSQSVANREHDYFMVFLTNGDDPNLVVLPTHRHIHSLPRFDFDELCTGARALFDVTPLTRGASADMLLSDLAKSGKERPSLVACAGDGRAALFALKADANLASHPVLGKSPEVLRRTDVALLHMGILEPMLGITAEAQAAKTNLWYPQDASIALGNLRGGSSVSGQVLFLMNASAVAQVRRVAEAGEVMPQKATFFYPKIMTGLAIHTLSHERIVNAPPTRSML
ncbi:MAG: DUF1015 domain-containing protein [Polyangiaceae bacterium]|nr:DUF1015 domain-containing protein [Polyangiaceae bacterium]